jgi:hypothetical protein
MSETLHTCPDCGQPNFTAQGLKSHKGGKTCLKRAAIVKTEPAGQDPSAKELQDCIQRFRIMHEAVKGSVLGVKLAKFFAGIEVQALCDMHMEEFGETRGGDQTKSKVVKLSALPLGTFLEQHLGVTDRTARRYRAHFLKVTQERPEQAERLRNWWLSWKDSAALQDTSTSKGQKDAGTQLATSAASALALHDVCSLAAKDIEAILAHADEFGLHELFEVPLKDVTPEQLPEPEAKNDAKERLAKIWLTDISKRLLNNEFLKLRKQDREALLPTLEDALNKLKDSLKGGKK